MNYTQGTLRTSNLFNPVYNDCDWIFGELSSNALVRPGDQIKLTYKGFKGEDCFQKVDINTFDDLTHFLVIMKSDSKKHEIYFGGENLFEYFATNSSVVRIEVGEVEFTNWRDAVMAVHETLVGGDIG